MLVPRLVDEQTNYRYYDYSNIEKARAIIILKELMFSLDEIAQILNEYDDEAQLCDFLVDHREQLEAKIKELKKIAFSIDEIIKKESEVREIMKNQSFKIEERVLEDVQIASIKWKGKYSDTGKFFSKLFKKVGFNLSGKPFNLYFDDEYKEDGADVESCVSLRKKKEIEGITVKTLKGGKCVSLIHKGQYEQIGSTYAKIIEYCKSKKYTQELPSREVYLKGPGMILKGNPKNYLTEVQILIK